MAALDLEGAEVPLTEEDSQKLLESENEDDYLDLGLNENEFEDENEDNGENVLQNTEYLHQNGDSHQQNHCQRQKSSNFRGNWRSYNSFPNRGRRGHFRKFHHYRKRPNFSQIPYSEDPAPRYQPFNWAHVQNQQNFQNNFQQNQFCFSFNQGFQQKRMNFYQINNENPKKSVDRYK